MPRPLRKFAARVDAFEAPNIELDGHFITSSWHGGPHDLWLTRLWVKPYWYSRRRCVAIFEGRGWIISSVDKAASDAEFLKHAGVKIS